MIICSASGENVISVFPVFFPFSLMKCPAQSGYIVSPLSEARQLQFEHVEAVEQIFSKQPVIDEFLQVLVRCRDDADVDRDDPVMTDTHDLPLLKNPEESALQLRSDIADLIEEDCPIVSELEQSSLTPFYCSGEGTVDVSEQFALKQVFRESRTVDGDERMGMARRGVVNALCEQFLTGSRLSVDENIRFHPGELSGGCNGIKNLLFFPDHNR